MRPRLGGRAMGSNMSVRFRSPLGRAFYPDYNLVFLPLRHLVLQGAVDNPKQTPRGSETQQQNGGRWGRLAF